MRPRLLEHLGMPLAVQGSLGPPYLRAQLKGSKAQASFATRGHIVPSLLAIWPLSKLRSCHRLAESIRC